MELCGLFHAHMPVKIHVLSIDLTLRLPATDRAFYSTEHVS